MILSVSVKQLLFFFVLHIGATRGILSCKGSRFAWHFAMLYRLGRTLLIMDKPSIVVLLHVYSETISCTLSTVATLFSETQYDYYWVVLTCTQIAIACYSQVDISE